MPPVRNGQYINVDDRSTASMHQMNDTKHSLHNHLSMQSPSNLSMAAAAAASKPNGQYASPSMQHPSGSQQPIQQTPLTKAELRKSNKPIMEKKRRARINHCLNELKTLILEAMKKDPARHTKLEKADILEMTVKYLQTMQRNQINATANVQNDPTVLYKFKAGFSDCTNEVSRYINQIDGVDATVKQRLMGHLNNCVTGIQQVATPYNSLSSSSNSNYTFRSSGTFNSNADLFGTGASTPNPANANALYQQLPLNLPAGPEINNNNRIQMGGVQFIPSRLPSGEFALVMPNSGNTTAGSVGGASAAAAAAAAAVAAADQWKPYYPVDALALRQSTIDLNETLPRSAFSNVTKVAKHLDTSPLSPASSMSSIDDSSSSLNQNDLQTSVDTSSPQRTPQKCLSAFPTPPSGGSITLIPTTTTLHSMQLQNSTVTSAAVTTTTATLQQPHVTSTTEQQSAQRIRPISLDLHLKETEHEYHLSKNVTVKRDDAKKNGSTPNETDDNDGDGEDDDDDDDMQGETLLTVVTKSEPKDCSINSDESNTDDQSESCNGDMWRPW